MQTVVFEAFREIGIPGDKALKAAAALSKRDADVASLKTDTAILKWMMGLMLAPASGEFRQAVLALMARARPDPSTAAFAARR
jgi:hypothetical protein